MPFEWHGISELNTYCIKYDRIGESIYGLYENDALVEIKIADHSFGGRVKIGQTYCARITKIDMRLSAAFLDLGNQSAILQYKGPRPKYLIEGNAIIVKVTKSNHLEKSANVKYSGDAKAAQPCPALLSDVSDWGIWPKPRDATGNEKQILIETIDDVLATKVALNGGGSIIIEPTKAMTAIDIDADGRISGGTNQSNFNHKLNLEAAKTIARQIRLRNISGLIIIDFVGAPSKLEAPFLIDALKLGLSDGRKCEILPISKFGICEIARERIGASLHELVSETKIAKTAHRIAVEAINALALALQTSKGKKMVLKISHAAHSMLTQWDFNWQNHLEEKIGGQYEIIAAPIEEYEII